MEWEPEFDVDEQLARRLIESQFPQLKNASLQRFGAGMDNAAFLIGERYVFRFPRRTIAVPLLEREELILPLIAHQVPLPIPYPQFTGKPDFGYPWTFAGYERIRGTGACSVPLSLSDRTGMAQPLGEFLRALHGIDPQIAVDAGLPADELGRLHHQRRLPLAQRRFAELQSAGLLDDVRPFLTFLAGNAPGNARPRRCIVHGDLYARHLLVDHKRRLCGIIDWGDVHSGDPALDLMAVHSMVPPSAYDAFTASYGGVDHETWLLAKYRAVYHGALVAHYGMHIKDRALQEAGLAGLRMILQTL
jgi:aminoglycoside phosphotransferase (APT) family kinase protein